MAYEHKAGFQTCEHILPANTRTHYTNISFYDTVAQSTANIRTCFCERAHTMFMRTQFTNMQKCCILWPGICPKEGGLEATCDSMIWFALKATGIPFLINSFDFQ